MGWTGYRATYFNKSGIDRKAECDAYFTKGSNAGYFKILKSTLRNNVYYAAVKNMVRNVKTENGGYEYIPIEDGTVWAAVFLTGVRKNEFFYKDMDETCGPYNYDCPESILKLLSETDNEYALKWRELCRKENGYKKLLRKLPVGTTLNLYSPDTFNNGIRKGDPVTLCKRAYKTKRGYDAQCWIDSKNYKWKEKFVIRAYAQSNEKLAHEKEIVI